MRRWTSILPCSLLLLGSACDRLADPPDEQAGDGDGDELSEDDVPNPEPELDCLPTSEPYVGSLSLESNEDVELLAGVSVVQGNLGVHWGVTDISGLECLTEVTAGFWIVETSVGSLAPLHNLVEVGGELEIGMAPSLVEIDLPKLEQVGYLSVYNNDSLTNMQMPELRTILQHAEVDDNINLPTCDVTTIRDALTLLGGQFYISNNLADGCG